MFFLRNIFLVVISFALISMQMALPVAEADTMPSMSSSEHMLMKADSQDMAKAAKTHIRGSCCGCDGGAHCLKASLSFNCSGAGPLWTARLDYVSDFHKTQQFIAVGSDHPLLSASSKVALHPPMS